MHPEKTLTASETASEAAFKADTSTGFSLNMRLAFRVLTSIWIRILDLTRALPFGRAASPG